MAKISGTNRMYTEPGRKGLGAVVYMTQLIRVTENTAVLMNRQKVLPFGPNFILKVAKIQGMAKWSDVQ